MKTLLWKIQRAKRKIALWMDRQTNGLTTLTLELLRDWKFIIIIQNDAAHSLLYGQLAREVYKSWKEYVITNDDIYCQHNWVLIQSIWNNQVHSAFRPWIHTGLLLYSICIVKKGLLSIYLKSMIDERFRESYLLFYFSQIWWKPIVCSLFTDLLQ